MEQETKLASASYTMMSELILPNDTNTLGNLMGGKLMYWMDIAGGLAAMKHCNAQVVTASVDNISFQNPIKLGHLLTIEAQVTRAFSTSMEIYLKVYGQDLQTKERYLSNEAYMTFVALGANGRPRTVPLLQPETDTEIEKYNGALRRRQLRLILAGKMKAHDANELKALFLTTDEKN
jgi:acyl-CoA hydrolase